MHQLHLTIYHHATFMEVWLTVDVELLDQWHRFLHECLFTPRSLPSPTFAARYAYPQAQVAIPALVNSVIRYATQFADTLEMVVNLCYPHETAMVTFPVDLWHPLFLQ